MDYSAVCSTYSRRPWDAVRDDETVCGGTDDRARPPDGAPLDGDAARLELDAGPWGCTDFWRDGLRLPRPVGFLGDGDGDGMSGHRRRAWDDGEWTDRMNLLKLSKVFELVRSIRSGPNDGVK